MKQYAETKDSRFQALPLKFEVKVALLGRMFVNKKHFLTVIPN